MSRFFLVEADWDLAKHYTTHDGVMISLRSVNGVLAVDDIDNISRDTLDLMLLPPDQSYTTIPKKRARR